MNEKVSNFNLSYPTLLTSRNENLMNASLEDTKIRINLASPILTHTQSTPIMPSQIKEPLEVSHENTDDTHHSSHGTFT